MLKAKVESLKNNQAKIVFENGCSFFINLGFLPIDLQKTGKEISINFSDPEKARPVPNPKEVLNYFLRTS